ncbi:MAG: diguanylate cyclase [Ilumatobacter sp.]
MIVAQLDVSLVTDEHGAPLHFISQIQDITAQTRTRRDLEAASTVQHACLTALEQGVAMTDLTGEVMFLNPAGVRILGRTARQLTELFRSGQWESWDKNGAIIPEVRRPIGITIRTGTPIAEQIVVWERPDHYRVTLRVTTEPVHDEHAQLVGVVVAFADITEQRANELERRRATSALKHQATHDELPGLANRRLLLEELDHLTAGFHHAVGDIRPVLLYLDVDDFKRINDTHGHAAGDDVLIAIANGLLSAVRHDDLVARLGGDEFVVLFRNPDTASTDALKHRVQHAIETTVTYDDTRISVSASIGAATLEPGTTVDQLLRHADDNLYHTKRERSAIR